MNIMSFAYFLTFIVYLWMIIFVLSKDSKALPNRVCALLILAFAIWSLGNMFKESALSYNESIFWLNVTSFGWCGFASFFLWSALILTKREQMLKKWYLYLILFFIPFVLIYEQWMGQIIGFTSKTSYGWEYSWKNNFWTLLYYIYYLSCIIISLYLFLDFLKITKKLNEKKQAEIIFVTSLTAFVLASGTDVLFPHLRWKIPTLSNIIILIWAGGMVYAITKYKLMVPTIAYAAKDILLTMTDSLVLTNPEGKIVEINKATLDMVGYSREEIIGQPVGMLFGEEENFVREDEFIADRRTNYVPKAKEKIPVDLSGSVVKIKNEDIIGVVYIARDRRETIKSEEEKGKLQKQILQSEKTIAVAQLAGGVAHEINNPMGVILGFTQSIVKKMEDSDFMHMPLRSIERETIKCKKLIEDLLRFSITKQDFK